MSDTYSFDAFISYEHVAKPIADHMVSTLEARNIRCWYAPRDVRGGYAASIMDAISKCRVFVVILDERSSRSPHVLNEVEAAYNRVVSAGLSIIPFRVGSDIISNEMQYYVKRLHWIDASNVAMDKAIESLASQICELLPDRVLSSDRSRQSSGGPTSGKRTANRYFELYGDDAADESRWLHLQNLILRDFDMPIYDRLIEGRSDIAVLDIGCSDGEVLNDRLGFRGEVTSLLGVDANAAMLAKAHDRFGSDERYTFLEADCEAKDFRRVLEGYLSEKGLTGFDFVNISMVILHLKRPYVLLRSLQRVLNPGACIFIRDIDDGLNIAHPDDDGAFARLNDLCASLPTTGCRTSGRQIFSMLKRAGYEDIVLDRSGLSTVGMSHEQRYALFMTCFDWLGGDLELRSREEPDNEEYRQDWEWFEDNVYDLEEQFQDSTFFYQEGFMAFTARTAKRGWANR